MFLMVLVLLEVVVILTGIVAWLCITASHHARQSTMVQSVHILRTMLLVDDRSGLDRHRVCHSFICQQIEVESVRHESKYGTNEHGHGIPRICDVHGCNHQIIMELYITAFKLCSLSNNDSSGAPTSILRKQIPL